MTSIVRLYTPADWSGKLICWRLEEPFCHAAIQIADEIYSATFPEVACMTTANPQVAQPPRGGEMHELVLSTQEEARALQYCRSMVGTSYDILSALGWALRIQSLQRKNHVYCFEYVYDALAAAGVFPTSKRLVTGEELLLDLYAQRRITMNFSLSERLSTPKHRFHSYTVPAPSV